MGLPPLFILPQYFGHVHSFDLSYLFGLTLSEPLRSLASYKFGDSTLLGPLNSRWASRTPLFSHTSLATPPRWPPTYFSASTPRWPPKQPPIPHRPPTPFISLYTSLASQHLPTPFTSLPTPFIDLPTPFSSSTPCQPPTTFQPPTHWLSTRLWAPTPFRSLHLSGHPYHLCLNTQASPSLASTLVGPPTPFWPPNSFWPPTCNSLL